MRICVILLLCLIVFAGCENKGGKLSSKELIVKSYLGKSTENLLFAHSSVKSDFAGLQNSLKTEAENADVWKALLGKNEEALLKLVESKNIAVIAVEADMDNDDLPGGSVIEAMLKAGELNLFSHIYMDGDVNVLIPTAKAFRISDKQLGDAVKYTRSKLADSKENVSLPSEFNEELKDESIVELRFTTAQGYNKNLGLIRGRGKNVKLALDNAISKAKQRYEAKGGGGFTASTLTDYVNDTIITLNFHREKAQVNLKGKKFARSMELGLDGVIMSFSDPAHKGKKIIVTPDKSKIYKAKSFENMLAIACRKAKLGKDDWKGDKVAFEKFRTVDVTEREPRGEVIRLFRGVEYVDPAKLDLAQIKEGFGDGAEWLLSILDDETGMFKYEYYTMSDKYRKGRYNIIRHGLAVLTLIQAYEIFKEEKYLVGAKRAIKWVNDRMEWEGKMAYFHHPKYDSSYKLGGAGVMLQCMCEYYRFKKMPEWDKIMKGLAEFMMHMQKDNGHYRSYYIKPGTKDTKGIRNKEVTIYPGEANLALVRMYKLFKDQRYLDTVEKAFQYYSEWFNNKKSDRSKGNLGPFVPWDMSAMMEYWEVVKRDDVATYAYQMADWLIDNWFAWGDKHTYWKDFVGGVKGNKRKNNMPLWNSGVYGEGLASVYRLAALKGDADKREKYRKVAFLNVRFIRNLQYRQGSVYYLPNVSSAIGAIPGTFHKDDCRLDYAYHCLTVNYRIIRFFEEEDWKSIAKMRF